MTKNLSVKLTDFNDKPIKESNTEDSKELTVGKAVMVALNTQRPKEGLTPEQSGDRYRVIVAIRNNEKKVELSSEQIADIKEAVSQHYAPLVYGQIIDVLEGK